MSVTMASLYITVHLFGIVQREQINTPYQTMDECVSVLKHHSERYSNNPRYQVTLNKENGYLAISDQVDKKIETHTCR